MAEEAKKVTEAKTTEAPAPKVVPQEQFDSLYKQALELDARYKRLLEAYNALFELYLSGK